MYLFKNVYSHFSRESLSIFTKEIWNSLKIELKKYLV